MLAHPIGVQYWLCFKTPVADAHWPREGRRGVTKAAAVIYLIKPCKSFMHNSLILHSFFKVHETIACRHNFDINKKILMSETKKIFILLLLPCLSLTFIEIFLNYLLAKYQLFQFNINNFNVKLGKFHKNFGHKFHVALSIWWQILELNLWKEQLLTQTHLPTPSHPAPATLVAKILTHGRQKENFNQMN